jgi:FkbM family methyltransferase
MLVRRYSTQSASGAGPLGDVFEWLDAQELFTIVQIGAHIGASPNDPLHPYLRAAMPLHPRARAVLVEPMADAFQQLTVNYSGHANIAFENVAIAEDDSDRVLHRVDEQWQATAPPGFFDLTQVSSLKTERMAELWHQYEGREPWAQEQFLTTYREHQVEEVVRCMTLTQLLAKHHIEELDLLQIDVEGYEYEILTSIDFTEIRPRFINYERVLLMDRQAEVRAMLRSAGYLLLDWDIDTLCIRVH